MTIKPGNGIRENQKRTLKGGKKQLSCFGASELGNSMTRCLAFLYETEKGYPDKVFSDPPLSQERSAQEETFLSRIKQGPSDNIKWAQHHQYRGSIGS